MENRKEISIKTIKQSEKVTLYSIQFSDKNISEFEDFMKKFKEQSEHSEAFNTIIYALNHMLEVGVQERFFRNEGGNLKALSFDSKNLRLYCLLISEQVLIVGNGDLKTTRTYQEDEKLNGYVTNLRELNKLLKKAQKKGDVIIEGNEISISQGTTFEI